jgi:hypothetical protein
MPSGVLKGEYHHASFVPQSINFPGRINGLRYTAEKSQGRGWLNLQLATEAQARNWKLDIRVHREQIIRRKNQESARRYGPGAARTKDWSIPPAKWGWCHKHRCSLEYSSSLGCNVHGYLYDCERCRDEQIEFGGLMRIVWLWYMGRIPLPPDLEKLGEEWVRQLAERAK